jgi:putative zinc finger/helix-turn-helix YgiT family protein
MSVPGCSYLLCRACGETVTDFEQTGYLFDRAFAMYRAQHRLLPADEIRAIRKRHGLTQGALAKLLKLGSNTISRWEAGRNVQSAAMDVLLRLIRDVPASLDYLRSHAA